MNRITVLATLIVIGAAGIAAQQGQGATAQPETLEIEKVKDNLFMIKNGGGNTGVFVTRNGVAIVDTVTQEHTKTNMEKMDAFKGEKAQFLPKRTFKDKMTLGNGADRIDLYYFGPGHTSGDALVVFPSLRVMHAGDLFAWKALPIMDRNNGGSGVAYPETLKKAAAGIRNVDSVIPGHSPVMPWAAFVEYGQFMQWAVDTVKQAAKEGKTEAEAAAAIKTPPDQYKDYTTERAAANVTAIYGEVKKYAACLE